MAGKQAQKSPRGFHKKPKRTSIYFLLWATFTAFSLLIILLLSITQMVVLAHTYKGEAAKEVQLKGQQINGLLHVEMPPQFQGNASLYVRALMDEYDVKIMILGDDGRMIYPQMPTDIQGNEQVFASELARVKEELLKVENKTWGVVFEGDGEYVYGAQIRLFGEDAYLYVGESLVLVQTAYRQMLGRIIVSSLFILVLAFAISSALSAWLVRPITEITQKAHRLAKGDFNVDFHGSDYGEEVMELAETLNYARDELSKMDDMQKQLIANVSHDFKTPLTMIKAYASMIIEISGEQKQKRDKHARIIIDESDRLTSLVNDVLALSKMRSGIEGLKMQTFDLSATLREIVDRFAYLKETKGYDFILDVQDEVFTCGDELKIGQVLYNLIGNAVNYTGEDKKVYVSLKQTCGVCRFSVRDTGAGIKKEELDGIWERYYRSSEAHKRPVQGTGLGLAIVKTVLERHHFVYGVSSTEGEGSTFYVDFPMLDEDAILA